MNENNADTLQNHPVNASSCKHRVGDKEWKQSSGRQMKRNACKPFAILSGQAIQQSNHLGDKRQEMRTFCKMIRPCHPAKQSSGRQIKRNECKPTNLWQNDPAKPSSKAIFWETNEQKWKQAFGNMIRPRHPAKQSSGRQMNRNESKPLATWSGQGIQQSNLLGDKWIEMKVNLWQNDQTNEQKWMQTCGNMIRPRHPAKQSSGRQMNRNESKPVATSSGQGIQQSNLLGDKWIEIKINLWQNDPAKACSKAIFWETNE